MKMRVKAVELDSLLNEQIGLIPKLFRTLKAGGKLIDDLGPLASELQGVRRALAAMKLPRALSGNSADDIIKSIFEATPDLKDQMDSVIATVITSLRNGEAVEIGDKAVEGAVRLRFKGRIKFTDPNTGLVTRTNDPVSIYLTVTKDGIVEGSAGLGKTGSSKSLKAWKANGGRRAGQAVPGPTPGPSPTRLGSEGNPYRSWDEAKEAIEGTLELKSLFTKARRLSRKYPDYDIPARVGGDQGDQFIFFDLGNGNLGAAVYRNGELTSVKRTFGRHGESISTVQTLMTDLYNAVGNYWWTRAWRGMKPWTGGRNWDYLKQVYFPSGFTKLSTINAIVDFAGATYWRPLSEIASLILRESGAMKAETAISLARRWRFLRLSAVYGAMSFWMLEQVSDFANWIMGKPNRTKLAALKKKYELTKSADDLRAYKEFEAEFIRKGRRIAYAKGDDPQKIRSAEDAIKYANEFSPWVAKFRQKIISFMGIFPEDTVGTWAADKFTSGNLLMLGDDDDLDGVENIEEEMTAIYPEIERNLTGVGEPSRVDSVEVDTTDADDFVPTPKPPRTIPATDTIGIKGFSKALDEALSSNNIIFKPARPSARMKVKITELKNED